MFSEVSADIDIHMSGGNQSIVYVMANEVLKRQPNIPFGRVFAERNDPNSCDDSEEVYEDMHRFVLNTALSNKSSLSIRSELSLALSVCLTLRLVQAIC